MLALAAAMAVGTASITSCSSKKDDPAPPKTEDPKPEPEEQKLPAPNVEKLAKLRQKALEALTWNKKAEVSLAGITKATSGGNETYLRIETMGLKKANGDLVTSGEVEVNFTEIYDRGNMVVLNKPLMGKNADGKLEPLQKGGMAFIEAKQGNDALESTLPFELWFTTDTMGDKSVTDRSFWRGGLDNAGNLAWEETATSADMSQAWIDIDPMHHKVRDDRFGWKSFAKRYAPAGTKTQIKVSVPEAYTGQNAAVYLAYAGEADLLAQLGVYDATGKHFTSEVGFVPVGKDVHVIFVSESEGKFAHAIKKVKIEANATVTIENKDLAVIETEALVKKINELE